MSLPTPYYEEPSITIYHGDCREILPHLQKVDAVITSPPYNFSGFHRTSLNKNGRVVRELTYRSYTDDMQEMEYKCFIASVMLALFYCLKDGGSCWWNYKGRYDQNKYYSPHWVIDYTPFDLRQDIIWKYPSGPDVALDKFFPRVEHVFWFSKGKPKMNPDLASRGNVWEITQHNGSIGHPAVFPEELATICITASTIESHIILDPFMGSGTTLVACQKLGRAGIGIEIDPGYFDIACKRVEDAMRQPDLFVETPAPAVQEQLTFEAAE